MLLRIDIYKLREYMKMEFTENDKDRIIERVKEGENALLEYTKEISEKNDSILESKSYIR
jgi:hypothetical protein